MKKLMLVSLILLLTVILSSGGFANRAKRVTEEITMVCSWIQLR
jgi:hypothetical protein